MTCQSFRKTMVKKPLEALLVQGRRLGLERTVSQADQMGSSADCPDDDVESALSRSSSGGDRMRGSIQVSKHRSHGTPGPKSRARRLTQLSTPARPLTRDLACKYGDRAD